MDWDIWGLLFFDMPDRILSDLLFLVYSLHLSAGIVVVRGGMLSFGSKRNGSKFVQNLMKVPAFLGGHQEKHKMAAAVYWLN